MLAPCTTLSSLFDGDGCCAQVSGYMVGLPELTAFWLRTRGK
jgi:hypothetical protein